MNAALESNVPAHWTVPWRAVARRYAWKEYRMLRGFWLGVATIAALEMLAARWLMSPAQLPSIVFASAWGAAALYAIGAAVTLFAAEREERTDDFLRLLPAHARALLVGKLSFALLSSIALAAAMSAVGWAIAGEWPQADSAADIAAIGGVALLEALAWGVLVSLLCPQPLLAAILAIAAASLAAQLAIACTPETGIGYTWSDYRAAIPVRLAFTAAVALLDFRLASRWLRNPPPSKGAAQPSTVAGGDRAQGVSGRPLVGTVGSLARSTPAGSISRRRMFYRLLWQSCREGWLTLVAAIVVGALFTAAELLVTMPLYRSGNVEMLFPLTLLTIPALLGALAFRADQRGSHYRFLAEHGARPSLVWTARQTAWLAPLLAATVAVVLIALLGFISVGLDYFADRWLHMATHFRSSDRVLGESFRDLAASSQSLPRLVVGSAARIWWACFAACALGQLASMFIHRTVMAGFTAILLSIILTLWSYVLFAWDLSPFWFLLPIGIAALAATWRRTPGWLTERTGWRSWTPPLAIFLVSVAAVVFALPYARIAQVSSIDISHRYLRTPLVQTLAQWERDEAAARAVAGRYERLAAEIQASDQRSLPPLFRQLAEISQAPRCRFSFPLDHTASPLAEDLADLKHAIASDVDRLIDAGKLDAALARLLTLGRMQAHLLQYQPITHVSWFSAYGGPYTLGDGSRESLLIRFATAPGQTSERLQELVKALWEIELSFPGVDESIVADHLAALDVIEGQQPSLAVSPNSPTLSREWLAFVANQLPWERRRAALALEKMTSARLEFAYALVRHFSHSTEQNGVDASADSTPINKAAVRQLLMNWRYSYGRGSSVPDYYAMLLLYPRADYSREAELLRHCRTSYLADLELGYHTSLPEDVAESLRQQAFRTGDIVRVALVAYHLDEGEYPDSLDKLVPRYVVPMPADPFGNGMFTYEPYGFELPALAWRQGGSGPQQILAGVPLLWSPGPAGAQPAETTVMVNDAGEFTTSTFGNDDLNLQPERFMKFPDGSAIVLPLPIIEPIAADSSGPPSLDGAIAKGRDR